MTVLGVGIPDYDDIVEIGRGAFSILYQGRQRAFGRPVAIKVLQTPGAPRATGSNASAKRSGGSQATRAS